MLPVALCLFLQKASLPAGMLKIGKKEGLGYL